MGDLAWGNEMRIEPQRHRDTEKFKRNSILCALCASVVLLFAGCAKNHDTQADLIFHHGRVVTVDHDFSMQQAIAVKEGKILRVGTDSQILKLKGPKTEVVDLKGRMVLPGLMDSHVHPGTASMTEFDHPVPTMESIADVLDYIHQRAQAVGEGKWVNLSQVFITRLT